MHLARAARIVLSTMLCCMVLLLAHAPVVSAACPSDLPTGKGRDVMTLHITKDASYRVWVRLYAPSAASDSVQMRIDDAYCAITVGNSGTLPPNAFTWVNYQDGDANKPIDVRLAAGDHTVTLAGTEADTGVDRLLFLTDTACVPTGTGDNCGNDTDATLTPFNGIGGLGNGAPKQAAAPKHHNYIWLFVVLAVVLLLLVAVYLFVARRKCWWPWRGHDAARGSR